MRTPRSAAPSYLFLHELAGTAGRRTLEGEDAHYVARVVRAAEGERLTASDGRGTLATLTVVHTRPDVVVEVAEVRRAPERVQNELWCGAPEGERADWLIEKLGELGVSRFRPLQLEREPWRDAQRRRERWERLSVAALRQSRSAWRLEILEPLELPEALSGIPSETSLRIVADEQGAFSAGPEEAAAQVRVAAIGPSSGFSAAERKRLAEAGFVPVGLALGRLRAETAAVALAARWAALDAARGPLG